jgi:large subunit ribosomal protein L15
MKLGDLHPAAGSTRKKKRRGKGRATGIGGTAGKGAKGHSSRSGGGVHLWFEGGQMPAQRRLPKRGFKRPQKIVFQVVDVGQVAELGQEKVDLGLLAKNGLVRADGGPVKLLADGSVSSAVQVEVHAASASAKAKIEAAGGSVQLVER